MTNVIELAKQAGFYQEPESSLIADKPEDSWFHCKQADIELLIKLVRNAALEEAAKACDTYDGTWYAYRKGAQQCAYAIRNLKEPTP